jgi:TatA/E family protein of Tat protein translocase
MPNIGPVELIIILVIALLILGPGKLPDVGAAIGKSIREFRKATNEVQDTVQGVTAPFTPPAQSAPVAPAQAAPVAPAAVAQEAAPVAPAPVEAAPVAPTPAPVPGTLSEPTAAAATLVAPVPTADIPTQPQA